MALKEAIDRLRRERNMFDKTKANDKSYVLEAVSRDWRALRDASDELQNDNDINAAYYKNDIGDDLGDDDPGDIGD